jgi:hypothetical protein
MFPDKDLSCNSKTISNTRKHQQNTAAVRLLDIVGICKPDTLSLTKVADNIIVGIQGKYKEFVRFLIHPPPFHLLMLHVLWRVQSSSHSPFFRRYR